MKITDEGNENMKHTLSLLTTMLVYALCAGAVVDERKPIVSQSSTQTPALARSGSGLMSQTRQGAQENEPNNAGGVANNGQTNQQVRNPADPIFDLNSTSLDHAELKKNNIRLHELNTVRLLQFMTNSRPFSIEVPDLPTGAMERTIFAVARFDEVRPNASLASYGVGGVRGGAAFLGLQYCNDIGFVGYGCDVSSTSPVEYEIYALAAVYSGDTLTLYVNGQPVSSNTCTLATVKTPVSFGGSFVGMLVQVRLWKRALTKEEVAAETRTAIDMLWEIR